MESNVKLGVRERGQRERERKGTRGFEEAGNQLEQVLNI
jgi:hypothetical protein